MTVTKNYDAIYQVSYDREARVYNERRFGSRRGRYAMMLKNELILKILSRYDYLGEDRFIIDIPSGTGRVAHMLLGNSRVKVCAADISAEMSRVNKGNVPEPKLNRIDFVQANMKTLPYGDETFDAAIMASFFYLVPCNQYSDYVSDIHRVLRPGGLLIAEVSNAFAAYNFMNFLKIFYHKHVRKKAVKSYVYSRDLRRLFAPFLLIELWGTEFPLIGKSYRSYQAISYLLGTTIPAKWLSGKFTIVLCKLDDVR